MITPHLVLLGDTAKAARYVGYGKNLAREIDRMGIRQKIVRPEEDVIIRAESYGGGLAKVFIEAKTGEYGFVCEPVDNSGTVFDPRPTLIQSAWSKTKAEWINKLIYQKSDSEKYFQSGGNQHYFTRKFVPANPDVPESVDKWVTTGDVYSWWGSQGGDLVANRSAFQSPYPDEQSKLYKNGRVVQEFENLFTPLNYNICGFSTKTVRYQEGGIDKALKVYLFGVVYNSTENRNIYLRAYKIEDGTAHLLQEYQIFDSAGVKFSIRLSNLRFNYSSTKCSLLVNATDKDITNPYKATTIHQIEVTLTYSESSSSIAFSKRDDVIAGASIQRSGTGDNDSGNYQLIGNDTQYPVALNYNDKEELVVLYMKVLFAHSYVYSKSLVEGTEASFYLVATTLRSMNIRYALNDQQIEYLSSANTTVGYKVKNYTASLKEGVIIYADVVNNHMVFKEDVITESTEFNDLDFPAVDTYEVNGNYVTEFVEYKKGVRSVIGDNSFVSTSSSVSGTATISYSWKDDILKTYTMNSSAYKPAVLYYGTSWYDQLTANPDYEMQHSDYFASIPRSGSTETSVFTNVFNQIFVHFKIIYDNLLVSGSLFPNVIKGVDPCLGIIGNYLTYSNTYTSSLYSFKTFHLLSIAKDDRVLHEEDRSTIKAFRTNIHSLNEDYDTAIVNDIFIESVNFKPDQYIHGKYAEFSDPELQFRNVNIGLY